MCVLQTLSLKKKKINVTGRRHYSQKRVPSQHSCTVSNRKWSYRQENTINCFGIQRVTYSEESLKAPAVFLKVFVEENSHPQTS